MHIMEGFLPATHCIFWGAVSAPFVVHGARKLRRIMRDQPQMRLTLAASGAFTFVLSALKMPSVTGSCSHPTGTGLGAVLFGPPVMAVLGRDRAAVSGAAAGPWRPDHAGRQYFFHGDRRSLGQLWALSIMPVDGPVHCGRRVCGRGVRRSRHLFHHLGRTGGGLSRRGSAAMSARS